MQKPKPDTRLTINGLSRRVKQHIVAQPQKFYAVCTPGLEDFLVQEVEKLTGAAAIVKTNGGVEFEGPFELVYRANLHLNTANRVLMRITSFTARSYPELFDKAGRISWERYLGFHTSVAFSVTAKTSRLHHAENVAQCLYEAVAENISPLGLHIKRAEKSALTIFARLNDDECTLSMDSSGERLYKRGYHTNTTIAPLRETIASALLLAADFRAYPVIADPLCGSGTFIIEAARMLKKIPAGHNRSFAFESWPSFGAPTWNHEKKKQDSLDRPGLSAKLYGGDTSRDALSAAAANAKSAGVDNDLIFENADCTAFNSHGRFGSRGLIISNLPYGKRLASNTPVADLYRAFGDHLKKSCSGWRFGLVLADNTPTKALGLRSEQEIGFINGGIPVRFAIGEL